MYRAVADGVIRIETTACDGGGVGSGFLIAPNLVATVAHVVAGADSVVLRDGTISRTGTVIGLDAGHEVALVRTSGRFGGHVFDLAGSQPEVGADVAAIGYPLAGPRSLSRGTVSGLQRSGQVDGTRVTGLIQTDAAINPGNSGGPLLDRDGRVIGLVEAKVGDAEGIGFAVPGTTAAGLLASWRTTPDPHAAGSPGCANPVGPEDVAAQVTVDTDAPGAQDIAATFRTYATGINTGDYDTAYSLLGPHARSHTSRTEFAAGQVSSYLFDIHLASVEAQGADTDIARVTFTSVQDPSYGHDGQACSNWSLTYTMLNQDGRWLIDRAVPDPGSPSPC